MNKKITTLSILLLLLISNILIGQVTVNSLSELLPYLDDNDVSVKLAPGNYSINAADVAAKKFSNPIFLFQGSNSTYDFTGVTINFDTDLLMGAFGTNSVYQIQITGNRNVLKNLTMVDDGSKYDKPTKGGVNILMDGSYNRIEGFDMTVKGSYPYGYGDSFGKGAGAIISHNKHSGVLVRGTSNHVLNCKIFQQSYGHILFFQGAVNGLIEGCDIESEMRSTDDMLAETSGPAFDIDFMTTWGYRLPPGYMKALCEAGVRAYASGVTLIDGVEIDRATLNPTVLNCTMKGVRAAVTLSQASGTETVKGCTAIGCERGFAIATGSITECSADAKYGAVLSCDSNDGITADITVLPYEGESYNGSKTLAFLSGKNHNVTIKSAVTNPDQSLKIKVSADFTDVGNLGEVDVLPASGININNQSNYPLILGTGSANCTVVSGGMVSDFGVANSIQHTASRIIKIEAEEYSNMSGVASETTTDEGAGNNVTDIDATDWLEYEINVPFAGTYSLDYRVASASTDGDFSISVNDDMRDQISFSATGGPQTWTTVRSSSPFFLNEGIQTIRLTANSANWQINYMDLLLECALVSILPNVEELNALGESQGRKQGRDLTVFPGNTAVLDPYPEIGGTWLWTGPNGFTSTDRMLYFTNVQQADTGEYHVRFTNDCGFETSERFTIRLQDSLTIEAEDYVAMAGVTIESTSDIGAGSNVTSMDAEDWVEYKLSIPYAANYIIDYRVASEAVDGTFLLNNGDKALESVSFAATGGAQTWSTVSSVSPLYLNAGEHTLRLTAKNAGWNINRFTLRATELVRACNLPLISNGFDIKNTTTDWTSGKIDISCQSDLSIFITTEGHGDLETADYLRIAYRLDGGEEVNLLEHTASLDATLIKEEGINGQILELFVQSHSGSDDAYYSISNISVLEYSDPFVRLEAEASDTGAYMRTEKAFDVGGGLNVGWTSSGDWAMYRHIDLTNVNSFDARVASVTTSTIEVRIDAYDGDLIGLITVPNTGGYQTWETANVDIKDVIGIHDVYFILKGSFNVNWFQASTVINNPIPENRLEAEDADAWLNLRTEASEDIGGGLNVGWIKSGDWFKFIDLDLSDIKSVNARIASVNSGATLEVRTGSSNGPLIGTISIPNTGGYQAWETVGVNISQVSGSQDLYFVCRGSFNINWFEASSSLIGDHTALGEVNRNEIGVYPNPVNEHFFLKNAQGAKLELYDSKGSLVMTREISERVQALDMMNFASGFYLLRLVNDEGVITNYKVIKQ